MSSNDLFLIDEGSPDWIEIYNPEEFSIEMSDFYLSDDPDDLYKWNFPPSTIQSGGFLLILASGETGSVQSEIHANFKLKSTGETLFLTNLNLGLIQNLVIPNLQQNKSYGAYTDGSEAYVIQGEPTLSSSNNNSVNLKDSHTSGCFSEGFSFQVESNNPDAVIRYSTNGSEPTADNSVLAEGLAINELSNTNFSISSIPTTPLEGPWPLSTFMWEMPARVERANVVNYAGFINGERVTEVYSKFFLIDELANGRYSYPIISLTVDSLDLFDYENGIYIPGARFDEDGFNFYPLGNYNNRGPDWERESDFNFIDEQNNLVLNTRVGIRMRGFGSAASPQKSMNIYLRDELGIREITEPVFLNGQASSYKRLVIRNSGQDFNSTHLRDIALKNVFDDFDFEQQEFKPCIVFINGEYWGIYNLREKGDKHFFEARIEEDVEVNLLSFCGQVEEGSSQTYNSLIDFVSENSMEDDGNYEYVKEQLDINSFIDFIIAEVYSAHADWPCNNFKIWKTDEYQSKWRYFVYDLDQSFGYGATSDFDAPSLQMLLSDNNEWPYCPCSTVLIRNLIHNEEFKASFVSRFIEHLNNALKPETAIAKISEVEDIYATEIGEHIQRWHHPESISTWRENVSTLKNFAVQRNCFMREHLAEVFGDSFTYGDCEIDFSLDDFLIYPNPSNGAFRISNLPVLKGVLRVVNTSGKEVFKLENVINFPGDDLSVSLRNIPAGMYLVVFTIKDQVHTERLVIE